MDSTYNMPSLETDTSSESLRTTGYFRVTRSATFGFIMALPLVLLYEVFIRLVNRGQGGGGVRIGPEIWMKNVPMETPVGSWLQAQMLSYGITAEIGMMVVIALVGVGIFLWDRRKKLKLRPIYTSGVILESAVLAVVFAIIVSFLTASIVQPAMSLAVVQEVRELGTFHQLVLSLGAGIYEELLFRVILTGGLFLVLKTFMPRVLSYCVAAVVGALLFSWVHYTGSMGDEFTLASFTFRAIGGLLLNAIYLLRGFGVAAWTHAMYDVYVVTGFFSILD